MKFRIRSKEGDLLSPENVFLAHKQCGLKQLKE